MKSDIRHIVYETGAMGRGGRTEAGVTLVEMLIVLAIITLLASLVIGMATHIDNQSRGRELEGTFAVLESALEEYREQTGGFPEQQDEGVATRIERSEFLYRELNRIASSRKILERISDSSIQDRTTNDIVEIYDPWRSVLDYRYDRLINSYPQLVSAGPDGIFNTPDDITSGEK